VFVLGRGRVVVKIFVLSKNLLLGGWMGCWVFVLVLCGVVRVSVSVRACRVIVCYN
jgi:hypothetical protein